METYRRKPNTECSVCRKPIYRRPNEIKRFKKVYCSSDCVWKGRGRVPARECQECGAPTRSTHKERPRKFCSRSCSNKGRRGISYSKEGRGNTSQQRLARIKSVSGVSSCMIAECTYGKVLEVHRHTPGHKGGEYEIGNMFSICPNHHAEITRGLLEVERVSNKELRPKQEGAAERSATRFEPEGT